MINKNVIHGFDLPNENLNRQYSLVTRYEQTWRDWLALTKFNHAIPTNGIVESIEKICSSNDYVRFVIIENEVKFYQSILDYYNQNYIVIKPGEWDKLEENDLICLSMPFAPIASITDWYYDLCKYIQDKPIYMFIDGAYLGTINKRLYIPDNCIVLVNVSMHLVYVLAYYSVMRFHHYLRQRFILQIIIITLWKRQLSY